MKLSRWVSSAAIVVFAVSSAGCAFIDRDLRDIPVAEIPQTQVVTTIIGGKIVYQK
jgi:predicted amidohydrolase YtcJ